MILDNKKMIKDARAELYQRLKERKTVEVRIVQLKGILRSLASTLSPAERQLLLAELKDVSTKSVGLTEAISDLFRGSGKLISATEIREELDHSGFDLSGYSQPLSTIFNTLRRMEESGKVRQTLRQVKGQKPEVAYEWIGD